MSYYSQYHDPRNFANPQFPQPKKSSSWVGWLLISLATLVAGFLLGQNVKIEEKVAPNEPIPPINTPPKSPKEDEITAVVVVEKLHVADLPKTVISTKYIHLDEDAIEYYINNFDDTNEADRLFCKREFKENPLLITQYPELAKLLGFWVDAEKTEEEPEEDTNQPL